MHAKKGQVAIFVIIAIVIVLGILLVVFARSASKEVSDPSKLDLEDRVIFDLQNCIDEQLGVAIQIVGLQGGHVNLPDEVLNTNIGPVTYGLKNGRNVVPSVSFMEKEINSYFDLILPSCIDENDYLGAELESSFNDVRTVIGSDRVSLNVEIFVSMLKDGSSETINKKISSEVGVRLREMRNAAWDIANLHVRAPNFVDITYLLESEFDVLFVPIDESLLYSITDVDNKINGVAFSYLMGVE